MIDIRKLTAETADLLWTVEDRRLDSERVVIRARATGLSLDYKALPGALWRVGGTEHAIPPNVERWIGLPGKAVYLAWLDDAFAGQIVLEAGEHRLGKVLDIRVAMARRRRGVGEALLAMAEDWARGGGLAGLTAETQDVNAGACQFFTARGFAFGGVDTLRYAGRSQQTLMAAGLRESALFFYKFFR